MFRTVVGAGTMAALLASCTEDPLVRSLDSLENAAFRNQTCELIFAEENPVEKYIEREREEEKEQEARLDTLILSSAERDGRRKFEADQSQACAKYRQEVEIAIGEAAKQGATPEQGQAVIRGGEAKAQQAYRED